MKTPECSHTSRVPPLYSPFAKKVFFLCYGLKDTHKFNTCIRWCHYVMSWCNTVTSPNVMTSYCDVTWSHTIGHNDLTWEFNSGKDLEITLCDLDLWPATLTYNPNLAKVKVNFRTKTQGHRSNGLVVRVYTDTHTHRQTETRLRFYNLDHWRGR